MTGLLARLAGRWRLPLAVVLLAAVAGCGGSDGGSDGTGTGTGTGATLHPVLSVADGDTITVDLDGTKERVRLIGIDAPELHNPVECFGAEAATYASELLTGASVELVADESQDDRDRYGRLLRYVLLADGSNVNATLVEQGYAFEHTYDGPYRYQEIFRANQRAAMSREAGLWSPATCGGNTSLAGSAASASTVSTAAAVTSAAVTSAAGTSAQGCLIKGNINAEGEKIYHQPGDPSYDDTRITESKGERYFCSVEEAVAAGWRAAGN